MPCKDCDHATSASFSGVLLRGHYYFRWRDAEIEIVGCTDHVKEVMEALGDYLNFEPLIQDLKKSGVAGAE